MQARTAVMTLVNGYDRTKNPESKQYRRMTLEEARELGWGKFPFLCNDGKVRRCRVNAAVKTWKRDPSRIEVPLKYGLYECWRDTASADVLMNSLLVEVTER